MNTNINIVMDNKINTVISCPHCFEQILIEELNCCIFRHGILLCSRKKNLWLRKTISDSDNK